MKPSKKEMKCEVMWYTGGEAFEKKKKKQYKKNREKGQKSKDCFLVQMWLVMILQFASEGSPSK